MVVEGEPGIFPEPVARRLRAVGSLSQRLIAGNLKQQRSLLVVLAGVAAVILAAVVAFGVFG